MTSEYTVREIHERGVFDAPHLARTPVHFVQSWQYGVWHGGAARHYFIERDRAVKAKLQVIIHKLPWGMSYGSIPHGPVLFEPLNQTLFATLTHLFMRIASREHLAFLRFDAYPVSSMPSIDSRIVKTPSRYRIGGTVQPQYEWWLNLASPLEEMRSCMHPKMRYNIGIAERNGVEVSFIERNHSAYLDEFYTFLAATAARNHFQLHERSYYERILGEGTAGNALLAIATLRGITLAMHYVVCFDRVAHYVFGASGNSMRNVMAPHLTQWRTISEAKRRGYRYYSFGGITPPINIYPTPPSWKGFSDFKKKFGGFMVGYGESYEYVHLPLRRYLYYLQKHSRSLWSS